MKKTYHVYPLDDIIKHDTDHSSCICNPKVEKYENGNKLVIHNSFDGREIKKKDLN